MFRRIGLIVAALAAVMLVAAPAAAQYDQQQWQQRKKKDTTPPPPTLPPPVVKGGPVAPKAPAAQAGVCVPSGFARLSRNCKVNTGGCQRMPENCSLGWCCP
jgi:hypothetical protein